MRLIPALLVLALASACSSAESGSASAPVISSVSEGKTLHNTVPATPESLTSGKKVFDKLCAECHGAAGDGVSDVAAAMAEGEVKPPDLTDDKWDHGSTDGEIFIDIRDGVGGGGAMKGLNGRPGIGPQDMWNLVNYIRSIHRKSK